MAIEGKSGRRTIWLPGFLQRKDKPHQLLGGMGYGDVVVLALGPLLSKVGGKNRVPETDILGCVVKGVAKVPGTALLHVWVAVLELPGLVDGGGHSGVGQQLVRGIKAGGVKILLCC